MGKKRGQLPQSAHPGPAHRPFGVTILILVVLTFTSLNALRLITAIHTREFLLDLPLEVPVAYLVITGAIWTGVGIPLLYGLWTRRKWSATMAGIAILLYSCYYWSDRLLVADSAMNASRWPFALGLTILVLCLTFLTLRRPTGKAYFTK